MEKARKLKSGNWNIQVYDGGKRRSFTAPTKREVEYKAAKYLNERKPFQKEDMTVREAVQRYIESSQVLSPTTLSAYKKVLAYSFPMIMDMRLSDLDNALLQRAINEELSRPSERTHKPLSAKTVKNEWGLLSSAFKAMGYSFTVRLPKYQKHIKDYPEPSEVLARIRGTNIELPCLLAMWLSFSLSEIRGINCSDISKGYITINRVRVDVDGGVKEKDNAKVETRIRRHRIPKYIMALIEKEPSYKDWKKNKTDSPLINMTRNQIYHYWRRMGFDLSFHDLRHLNASVMLMLNIPEKYAMERGGWKTPHVMKSVYQHTFSSERVKVDDMIDDYFDRVIEQDCERRL